LAIDHPWQYMEPGRVDGFAGDAFRNVTNGGDAATLHANVGEPFANVVDDGATLENEVEGLCHGSA
jgi:hypothetical protein